MSADQFWILLEPEHGQASAFCRKLTGNRDEGDDLYQDSLVRALRHFDSLRDSQAFKPWLYRILINTYRNRYRQPWWKRRVPLTGQAVNLGDAGDLATVQAARRWLRRGLAALSADDRALVCLYELEGWSVAELATMFRRPQGTIKARLARSRKKMRRAIERYLNPDEEDESVSDGAAYALPESPKGD
jgi:RNA polymerase sigma-70 factor (ECF subfamily)